MRVLLVEDHAKLATTVAAGLRREGMAVDVAFDGNDALAHVAGTSYDVVVLDRDLPGIHGDEVCRTLVADGCPSRVLMLTAAGTVADRVEGLGLGADDYLAKPFACRRAGRPHPSPGPAPHPGAAPDAGPRRSVPRHRPPGRDSGGPPAGPQPQGTRRPRTPAGRTGTGR